MTRCATLKKIFAGVLLCCVLFGLVPVPALAQTTPTATNTTENKSAISAYTGWDTGKKVTTAKYASGDDIRLGRGEASVLGVPKAQYIGKTFEIDGYEKDALTNKLQEQGVYSTLLGTSLGVNPSDFYGVSIDTAAGKKSIYYYRNKDKNSATDDIVIGIGDEKGEFTIPTKQIIKASGSNTPNSTDVSTEQGFLNAYDVANGRAPNTTYKNFRDVDQYNNNKQEKETVDSERANIQKQLDSGKDLNGKELTPDQIKELEKRQAELNTKSDQLGKDIENGTAASGNNYIDTKACEGTLGFTNPGCWVTGLAILANIALKLSSFVLYITGNLFDLSLEIAVNSAEFIESLQIITPTWAVVRDVLNMTFIFILLYIAVKILLGRSGYNAKNSIVRLVLVAILMNFSLFAAKLMVDGSNIISLKIYEAMKAPSKDVREGRGSISSRIMTTLGMTTIFNFGDAFDNKTIPGCNGTPGMILSVGVFGTILILVVTLTFLLAGLLFLLRLLNIIVLFISSPVWIWGMVMENGAFRKATDWWQNNMWTVLKFPVVFMLMLYVALAMFAQLSTGLASNGSRASLISLICDTTTNSSGISGAISQFPIVLNFMIVIGALIMIVKYSAGEAGKGGVLGTDKLAANLTKKFSGYQQKMTIGLAKTAFEKSKNMAAVPAGYVADSFKNVGKAGLTFAKTATVDQVRKGINKVSNAASDKLGQATVGQGYLGKLASISPRARTALAGASAKLKNRKIFGETEKEALERRKKPSKERQAVLEKVTAEQLEIKSWKAWKEKNPSGTPAEYQTYIEGQVSKIEEAQLGDLKNEERQVRLDAAGNPVMERNAATVRGTKPENKIYEKRKEKDERGNEIEVAYVNQAKLYENLEKVFDHYNKKKDSDKDSMYQREKKKRWELMRGDKAKGRLDAKKDALKNAKSAAKTKQTTEERLIKRKKELEETEKWLKTLEDLPEDISTIDKTDPVKYAAYHKEVRKYIDEEEKIIKDANRKLTAAASDPVKQAEIRTERDRKLGGLVTTSKQEIGNAREKLAAAREKKLDEIEKLEEQRDKK